MLCFWDILQSEVGHDAGEEVEATQGGARGRQAGRQGRGERLRRDCPSPRAAGGVPCRQATFASPAGPSHPCVSPLSAHACHGVRSVPPPHAAPGKWRVRAGGGGLSELPRDGSCGPHLKAPALPAPGGAEGHPRLHRRRGPAGTGLAESPQATALPLRPRPLPAALSSPKPASGRRAPSFLPPSLPWEARAAHSLGSTHLHASPS